MSCMPRTGCGTNMSCSLKDKTNWFWQAFETSATAPHPFFKLWTSRPSGPFDYKIPLEQEGYKDTGVPICGKTIDYQSPGNFVFGCTGAQTGLPKQFFLYAGSADEITKRLKNDPLRSDKESLWQSVKWFSTTGSFDNPTDSRKISEGYDFCRTLKSCVTPQGLCQVLSPDR